MKEHTPVIVYEGGDYLPQFKNWSIYDRLQIQNNFLKYTYCEMISGNYMLITGSLLLGSIYSLLTMIDKALKTLNKESKLMSKLTITANEKMIFRIQKQVMNIVDVFTETYYLEKSKEHKIEYCFNAIDNHEINKFTNRFLALFTSENSKSRIPFLSTTVLDIFKFRTLLLKYANYFVTDN